MELNGIILSKATQEEKNNLKSELQYFFNIEKETFNVDNTIIWKLDFIQVFNLVSRRKVIIKDGYAYVIKLF
jgi:DNA primase large subunit